MASPSTGAGILLTGPTSTPDRIEKSDGGQLAEQQQQQHDAADLRITRLEADVSTIKESIVTQSGSMTQMMAMMQLMVDQRTGPKSDTIAESTAAGSSPPQAAGGSTRPLEENPAAAAAGGGGEQKLDGQLGSDLGTSRANSLALSALTSSQAAASSTTSDINSMTPSNKNPSTVAAETAGIAAGAASNEDCPDWESWGDPELTVIGPSRCDLLFASQIF